MRLSFGTGIVFLPFACVASTEYVAAGRYGAHLSDVLVGVVAPFLPVPSRAASHGDDEEVATRAVVVPEEPEPEGLLESSIAGKMRGKTKGKGQPFGQKALPSIHVSAQTVLRIANSGKRPSGRSVTAEGQRPAGVQVFGASALGVGVRDGDVITLVNGVPVTSANQVIALIIAARGARQATISGKLYRGQRSYTLTVEQPYLRGEGDAPKAETESPSGQAVSGLDAGR